MCAFAAFAGMLFGYDSGYISSGTCTKSYGPAIQIRTRLYDVFTRIFMQGDIANCFNLVISPSYGHVQGGVRSQSSNH